MGSGNRGTDTQDEVPAGTSVRFGREIALALVCGAVGVFQRGAPAPALVAEAG